MEVETVPVCDCSPYPNHGPDATPCNCGESCAIQRVPKRTVIGGIGVNPYPQTPHTTYRIEFSDSRPTAHFATGVWALAYARIHGGKLTQDCIFGTGRLSDAYPPA